MRRTGRVPAIRGVLAFSMLLGFGGGCIAIYGFDDFEKKPPRACKTTADCPKTTECGQYVCEGQVCKVSSPVAAGQLTTANKLGDCLRLTCDGRGNEIAEMDDMDVPDDRFACTIDACENGAPVHRQGPEGTPCGMEPYVICNSAGACAGCFISADCGDNTDCTTWACENSICVKNIELVGTVIKNSVLGDCRAVICDSFGEAEEAIVPDDAPSDGNECTADACTLEGMAEHIPSSIDTPCGTCGLCASDGSCVACDQTAYDCYNGKCVPKPKKCTSTDDCSSKHCVDGYCCDTECSSTCMACSNDKTGIPSGLCGQITEGTDPDAECNNPAADTCSQGSCRCENGKGDGDESGVDCGGSCNACTGKWSCGGITACDGVGAATSCCNYPACFDCIDQRTDCQNLEGQTCALGATTKTLSFGTVFQAGCASLTGCKTVKCNCVP